MPQSNRADPRAKALKDHLAAIAMSPRSARDSPLLSPSNLERLTAAFHLPPSQLETTPDEQVRSLGKAIVLSLFLRELRQGQRDIPFLQGLVLFWHSYLAPISATHPAPSVASVIAHSAKEDNWREFLVDARRWASAAYADDAQALREALGLLTPEKMRQIANGLPSRPTESERRTYGNYLNAAAREIAVRLEAVVPEFFAETEQPGDETQEARAELAEPLPPPESEPPLRVGLLESVDRVISRMYKVCARLPALGDEWLPVQGYLDRPLHFQPLRGEPRPPELLTGTGADVKGISGFLTGVLGEGRTAFLRQLAYGYAHEFNAGSGSVLPYYFSAKDFVVHARNRRSVHEFIADTLLAADNKPEGLAELAPALRALDEAGKLLLLVDDLDRLPSSDQSEVLSMLAFSPAVVFAVLPWQVDELSKLTARPALGVSHFQPLDAQARELLLDRLARTTEVILNWGQVRQLFFELPYLAEQPLGLVVILDQMQKAWTDMTRTAETALEEYARRAGLPPPPYQTEPSSSPRPTRIPQEWVHMEMAAGILDSVLRIRADTEVNDPREMIVRRDMVENQHGYHWGIKWDEVMRMGLFRPIEYRYGIGAALVKMDLACYLMAQQAHRYSMPFEFPVYPIHPEAKELLYRAVWHRQNLRNPNRHLPPRRDPPPPFLPERAERQRNLGSLLARIPKIFREFS